VSSGAPCFSLCPGVGPPPPQPPRAAPPRSPEALRCSPPHFSRAPGLAEVLAGDGQLSPGLGLAAAGAGRVATSPLTGQRLCRGGRAGQAWPWKARPFGQGWLLFMALAVYVSWGNKVALAGALQVCRQYIKK